MLRFRLEQGPGEPGLNQDFNAETSGGVCTPKDNGLIAKDAVSAGAKQYTERLPGITDPKLYSTLLMASWCGKRLNKWPAARDSKQAIDECREEFEELVKEKGKSAVHEAISLIPDFDSRIVSDLVEGLNVYEQTRMIHSPLFIEFNKHYPYVNPETLEKCYHDHAKAFVPAAIFILRRKFKDHPPAEFENKPDWRRSWQQHLPRYLKLWQSELVAMENRLKTAQRAWTNKVESMS